MTGEAIRVAMNMMANGGRQGVPGVVFVVTDGRPTYEWDATAAAEEARRSGTRLFFIGVGRNMDWAAMGRWATAPSTQNLEFVENYAQMDDKIAALTADLCPSIECKETFEEADESDYIGCQQETVSQAMRAGLRVCCGLTHRVGLGLVHVYVCFVFVLISTPAGASMHL